MTPMLLPLIVAMQSTALANQFSDDDVLQPTLSASDLALAQTAPSAEAANTRRVDPKQNRVGLMEANVRTRILRVPNSIMDVWFFDSDDQGSAPYDRPRVGAYSVGLEYVLKPRPVNWIFYYEYIGSLMSSGYWDDVEEPPQHGGMQHAA